jgi:hypothetical protein
VATTSNVQEQLVVWDRDVSAFNRTAEEKKLTLVSVPPR